MKRRSWPIAVDLFAGCGGLTQGLRQAGFRVIGAVEIDAAAASIYRANHTKVKLWISDIRLVGPASVLRKLGLARGELDLLAGCPPCQGFSTMRNLNGGRRIRDSRNSLIDYFGQFVAALLPRVVMLENVPRLTRHASFLKFRNLLLNHDYQIVWQVLDAADYGVPQRRRRLVLIASRVGPISFATPDPQRRSVADAIGGIQRAGESGDEAHDLPERRSPRVSELIARIPRDGGSRTDLGAAHQLACHVRCDGFKDVYGRMSWDDVAPTITSGCHNPSKGRFIHPEENRAITIREAALLQSFPPTYGLSTDCGKERLAGFIGNALPPEFVRRHALKIREAL